MTPNCRRHGAGAGRVGAAAPAATGLGLGFVGGSGRGWRRRRRWREAVGWRPCCDVVGGSSRTRHGFGLAAEGREEKRGEQGKRNRKGTGFSAPLARSPNVRAPTRQLLDFGALFSLLFVPFWAKPNSLRR